MKFTVKRMKILSIRLEFGEMVNCGKKNIIQSAIKPIRYIIQTVAIYYIYLLYILYMWYILF
jgi:hypothetical protein